MLLNDFMNENFPNLELRPPLFYSWRSMGCCGNPFSCCDNETVMVN